MNKISLWTNSNRSRYFLIPNNQNLPPGNFTIQTLTGITKQVDVTALTPLEITAEQAKPYFQAELEQSIQQVKNAFSTFADFAAAAKGQTTSNTKPPQPSSNPIATLLGISPEELRDNPQAIKAGWNKLVDGFKDLLRGATSEDETHLEVARTRMRQLREHLQAQGVEVNNSIEELPNKLRENYLSSDTEPNLVESAAKLEETTNKLKLSFTDMIQTLKESGAKLQNLADE